MFEASDVPHQVGHGDVLVGAPHRRVCISELCNYLLGKLRIARKLRAKRVHTTARASAAPGMQINSAAAGDRLEATLSSCRAASDSVLTMPVDRRQVDVGGH